MLMIKEYVVYHSKEMEVLLVSTSYDNNTRSDDEKGIKEGGGESKGNLLRK